LETHEWDHKEAKGIPKAIWLENMTLSDEKARTRFDSALKRQKLFDLSIFREDFFHEVPLFSRYEEMAGISDALLIELSLNYLNGLVSYLTKGQRRFFAALSFVDYGDDVPLRPYIFVCIGNVHRRCRLVLSPATSVLAKRIDEYASTIHPKAFAVFEDRYTLEDDYKVFLGHVKGESRLQYVLNEFVVESGRQR
jgi:hypothetical protein